MKDYKEMADSVFEKMKIYEEKKAEKRKTMVKMGAAFASIAIVSGTAILIGTQMSGGSGEKSIALNEMQSPASEGEEEELAGGKTGIDRNDFADGGDTTDRAEGAEAATERNIIFPDPGEEQGIDGGVKRNKEALTKTKDILAVNKGGDWIAKCNIPSVREKLTKENEVRLDEAGLRRYYKRNIFPTVPKDLSPWEVKEFLIYKKENGEGEVYYDRQVLNYSDKDFQRNVTLEVERVEQKESCAPPKDGAFRPSFIKGKSFLFFKHEGGIYSAELILDGTIFRPVMEGLNEEEAVNIVTSLIEGE